MMGPKQEAQAALWGPWEPREPQPARGGQMGRGRPTGRTALSTGAAARGGQHGGELREARGATDGGRDGGAYWLKVESPGLWGGRSRAP